MKYLLTGSIRQSRKRGDLLLTEQRSAAKYTT